MADERDWGVFDTWQDVWCEHPLSSYDEALRVAKFYNQRGDHMSRRYQAQRRLIDAGHCQE